MRTLAATRSESWRNMVFPVSRCSSAVRTEVARRGDRWVSRRVAVRELRFD